MALTLREWLKQKLDSMVSIQTTHLNHDGADLVAYAWSGKQLRIHLIGDETRTRALRNSLQKATEIGVNTLFIVSRRIFPEDGHKMTAPAEWLIALHALNNERIYTFHIHRAAVEIRPVHLEEIPGSIDRKTWYGPLVDFEQIRFYRTKLNKPRSLRGEWLVADFGSHAYWRNADYRNYRFKQEQQEKVQQHTYWETWSTGKTWASSDEPSHRTGSPMQSHLDACYNLLGVNQSASRIEVKRAFRKMAITFHPDTSELPADEAAARFRAINDAYDYIRSAKGWH